MNKKKILWILLLVIVITVIIGIVCFVNSSKNSNTNSTSDANLSTYNKSVNNGNEISQSVNTNTTYQKTQLDDGILYSIDGKQYKSDIVIGDNYFDTTINDMYLNFDSYKNKNIEIEGMYLENLPYMFVGRYSTSNLCSYCPVGYSYLEFQLKGKIDKEFTEEKDWLKVIGTLTKGNDATSNYQDYYYLEVLSLEIMNQKGQDTVNN